MITLSSPLPGNDVVHNMRAIMVTLEKVAARHGFSLNTKKKNKTECVITFAGKGIMEVRRALDWQEDHAQLQNGDGGILRQVDSYKHLGTLMTNICAGSQRWLDVRKRRVQSLLPSPSACCVTRSSLCRSDDKPLWLVSTGGPFLCNRLVVSSVEARVAFAQWNQVSFAPLPCKCETRARTSDR